MSLYEYQATIDELEREVKRLEIKRLTRGSNASRKRIYRIRKFIGVLSGASVILGVLYSAMSSDLIGLAVSIVGGVGLLLQATILTPLLRREEKSLARQIAGLNREVQRLKNQAVEAKSDS